LTKKAVRQPSSVSTNQGASAVGQVHHEVVPLRGKSAGVDATVSELEVPVPRCDRIRGSKEPYERCGTVFAP
jgi:hypothetical protein